MPSGYCEATTINTHIVNNKASNTWKCVCVCMYVNENVCVPVFSMECVWQSEDNLGISPHLPPCVKQSLMTSPMCTQGWLAHIPEIVQFPVSM